MIFAKSHLTRSCAVFARRKTSLTETAPAMVVTMITVERFHLIDTIADHLNPMPTKLTDAKHKLSVNGRTEGLDTIDVIAVPLASTS